MSLAPVLLALAAATASPAPDPAAPSLTCIDVDRIMGQEGAGKDAVVFRMSGGRVYRNRVRGVCPGLEQVSGFNSLALEPQGTRLCNGDFVRPFDPQQARAIGLRSFPRCPLGDFEDVTPPRPPR